MSSEKPMAAAACRSSIRPAYLGESSFATVTAVYLAGVLLPCLVTAITVAKELSPRYAGRMLLRQAAAAIGFSLLIGWGGAVLF